MLKSSEVVRGTITDSIAGTSVTILAGDSLSRTILQADIQLITTEIRRKIHTQKLKDSSDEQNTPKSAYYQGILSAGFGKKLEGDNTIKLNFINGFGFSEIISIGMGIGIRKPLENDGAVLPLFFDIHIRPSKSHIAPVVGFGAGTAFQLDRNMVQTGKMAYLEAGISIKSQGKSAVMITLGYETFDMFIDEEDRWSYNSFFRGFDSQKRVTMSTLTLNLGVAF